MPVLPHRRTERVPAEPLEPITTAGRHDDGRMEIKPLLARMPAAERRRIRGLDRVAPATHGRVAPQGTSYAVAPDGKRILIRTSTDVGRPMTLLLNWTAALKP